VVNEVGGHTIAMLGCSDLIVVHTEDATMIVPRAEADRLKELHERLPDELR
jgi:mannose-1-phosphate guanylyltransferase